MLCPDSLLVRWFDMAFLHPATTDRYTLLPQHARPALLPLLCKLHMHFPMPAQLQADAV